MQPFLLLPVSCHDELASQDTRTTAACLSIFSLKTSILFHPTIPTMTTLD